ncbi:MAG: DUF975 family protein [Candidatus Izemoplasmatales bacterium]|nr:DUF975 family protein [Candidatus Izemoplasmatales bacterium]
MKQERSFYRDEARSRLVGRYGEVILYTIIVAVITGIITSLTDTFRPEIQNGVIVDQGIPALVVLFIFSAISFLVSAGITYSTTSLYIDVADGGEFEIFEKLKSGFVEEYGRNIVLVFMEGLFIFLWSLLLVIPGIIKSYAYNMSMYLAVKDRTLGGVDAITKSKNMMNGNKSDLFLLDLSYIGWYLLSILTLGILLLWVIPRHQTARTLFFNEIYYGSIDYKPEVEEEKVVEEEALF